MTEQDYAARVRALREAAKTVVERGHFPGCAMHAGATRMLDEGRCDCGILALREALAAPAPSEPGL